jgi:hypothetical protein
MLLLNELLFRLHQRVLEQEQKISEIIVQGAATKKSGGFFERDKSNIHELTEGADQKVLL